MPRIQGEMHFEQKASVLSRPLFITRRNDVLGRRSTCRRGGRLGPWRGRQRASGDDNRGDVAVGSRDAHGRGVVACARRRGRVGAGPDAGLNVRRQGQRVRRAGWGGGERATYVGDAGSVHGHCRGRVVAGGRGWGRCRGHPARGAETGSQHNEPDRYRNPQDNGRVPAGRLCHYGDELTHIAFAQGVDRPRGVVPRHAAHIPLRLVVFSILHPSH